MDTANADDERFTANLRAAREEAGLSHQDMAMRMRDRGFESFHRQTIQRIESGRRGISVGEGLALAQCVGANFLDLALRSADARYEGVLVSHAIRRFRESGKQLKTAAGLHSQNRVRLEAAVKRARGAGFAEELAREITAAERLLAEEAEQS